MKVSCLSCFGLIAVATIGVASVSAANLLYDPSEKNYSYWASFDPDSSGTLALPSGWTSSLGKVDTSSPYIAIPTAAETSYFLDEGKYPSVQSRDYSLGTNSASAVDFSFSLTNLNAVNLTNFKFSFNESKPTDFAVFYSFDQSSWTAVNGTTVSSAVLNTPSAFSASLGDTLQLTSGSTLYVRWTASAGTSVLDDVYISATTAVPEPSTYALLLGVGTLGLVGYRRFRRK